MKTVLTLISLVTALGAQAQSAMPSHVTCTNPAAGGKTLYHSFEFHQRPEQIYPPRYNVRIYSALLVNSQDPDEEVGSDQPVQPGEVLIDLVTTGRRDSKDANLIYFDKSGFAQLKRARNAYTMTLQLPGQSNDMAAFIENCLLPEPRAGVGN